MANLFKKKKFTANITADDPVFTGKYIGRTEVFAARGKGCTEKPVQKLWDGSVPEKKLPKVTLTIGVSGITVQSNAQSASPTEGEHRALSRTKSNSGGTVIDRHVPIRRITFCSVDKIINSRIFAWIHREKVMVDDDTPGTSTGVERMKIFCTAILLVNVEQARMVASVLARAFHIASKDYESQLSAKERREMRRRDSSKKRLSTSGSTSSGGGVPSAGPVTRESLSPPPAPPKHVDRGTNPEPIEDDETGGVTSDGTTDSGPSRSVRKEIPPDDDAFEEGEDPTFYELNNGITEIELALDQADGGFSQRLSVSSSEGGHVTSIQLHDDGSASISSGNSRDSREPTHVSNGTTTSPPEESAPSKGERKGTVIQVTDVKDVYF